MFDFFANHDQITLPTLGGIVELVAPEARILFGNWGFLVHA